MKVNKTIQSLVNALIATSVIFSTSALMAQESDAQFTITTPKVEHTITSNADSLVQGATGGVLSYQENYGAGSLVGVKTEGDITIGGDVLDENNFVTGDALAADEKIILENLSSIGSAVGLWVQGSSVGAIRGDIEVSAGGSSTGIFLASGSIGDIANANITVSSQNKDATGVMVASGAIASFSEGSVIQATTQDGVATALTLEAGSILDINGASFIASTNSQSSAATALFLTGKDGGEVQTPGHIHGNFSASGRDGQISAILVSNSTIANSSLISGTVSINSANSAPAEGESAGYSIGYLIGLQSLDTTTSIALKNTITRNSEGIDVDWDNININVSRDYGLSSGVAIFGSLESAFDALGNASSVTAAVKHGASAGAWLNGTQAGDMDGDISSSALTGASVGLITTGHALAGDAVDQSTQMTTIGDISGDISASIGSNGMATGLLIGSTQTVNTSNPFAPVYETVDYTTTVGTISGNISASASSNDNVIVTGIEDISTNALNFASGASVSARIQEGEKFSYGDAILNTKSGITLKVVDSSTNRVAIKGNLNAGEQSLSFNDGRFDVSSTRWDATAGLSFGSDDGVGSYETTHVLLNRETNSLSDITTIESTTMEFYLNSASDFSQLQVSSGLTLDLDGLHTVNVHLSGSVEDYLTGLPIALLDATQADGFTWDDVEIDYNLILNGAEIAPTDNFYIVHNDEGIFLIPEPSTATLSLMALAGLLARRRRK